MHAILRLRTRTMQPPDCTRVTQSPDCARVMQSPDCARVMQSHYSTNSQIVRNTSMHLTKRYITDNKTSAMLPCFAISASYITKLPT